VLFTSARDEHVSSLLTAARSTAPWRRARFPKPTTASAWSHLHACLQETPDRHRASVTRPRQHRSTKRLLGLGQLTGWIEVCRDKTYSYDSDGQLIKITMDCGDGTEQVW
jgi:hypothetical protein